MEANNIDFNAKLKKISKDLVESFYRNDFSPKNKKINNNDNDNNESNQSKNKQDQNFSYSEIIIQKKSDFYPIKFENNNIADSYRRLLFTEQTTKSSVTNNYLPQEQNKISSIKTKTNNKNKKVQNKYNLDLGQAFSFLKTNLNYKAKQESIKEKKLYEEKVQILRKHIQALQKQQSDLTKKAKKIRENEKNKTKIKNDKESIKKELLSLEIDKRNEMETKKKNIKNKKNEEVKGVFMSKNRTKKDKIKEYKKALIQKKIIKEIINEDNNKSNGLNKSLIDQIRTERKTYKQKLFNKKKDYINKVNNSYRITYHNNINETEKLKKELIKLEKLEEEYLVKMKYTQDTIKKNKNLEQNKYKKYEKMKSDDNIIKKNLEIKTNKRKTNSVIKRFNDNDIINLCKNKRDKTCSVPKKKMNE